MLLLGVVLILASCIFIMYGEGELRRTDARAWATLVSGVVLTLFCLSRRVVVQENFVYEYLMYPTRFGRRAIRLRDASLTEHESHYLIHDRNISIKLYKQMVGSGEVAKTVERVSEA
jgi:hypothetical protein